MSTYDLERTLRALRRSARTVEALVEANLSLTDALVTVAKATSRCPECPHCNPPAPAPIDPGTPRTTRT